MKLRFFLSLALMALSSPGVLAQGSHDGNWWTGLSPGSKLGVITGFLDGMALGHNLSLMGAAAAPTRDAVRRSRSHTAPCGSCIFGMWGPVTSLPLSMTSTPTARTVR